ncbi:hypothetical protein IPJ91_02970 [bacterium]|nr:MAG: hypothetical protein IPJ91_02970 [bacterium]
MSEQEKLTKSFITNQARQVYFGFQGEPMKYGLDITTEKDDSRMLVLKLPPEAIERIANRRKTPLTDEQVVILRIPIGDDVEFNYQDVPAQIVSKLKQIPEISDNVGRL